MAKYATECEICNYACNMEKALVLGLVISFFPKRNLHNFVER